MVFLESIVTLHLDGTFHPKHFINYPFKNHFEILILPLLYLYLLSTQMRKESQIVLVETYQIEPKLELP